MAGKSDSKTIIDNRAARFHYEIIDEFVAGLELTGPEVKSLRAHKPQFRSAYIMIDPHGAPLLRGLDIAPYAFAKDRPHDRLRDRRLLLSSAEIEKIRRKLDEDRLTAIPLNLHFSRQWVKLRFALARGKKKYEKREAIKQRDLDRELRRSMN